MEKDYQRFVLFPIKYNDLWSAYKEALASFWVAEEIDLTQDLTDWSKLNDNERFFIGRVLGFFAGADGIVGENLATRFYNDTNIPEARAFYGFQLAIEMIHSEVYSLLIDTYIKDEKEKSKLFNAIEEIPVIKKKAEWALKWLSSDLSFEERLIAFSVVEGVFFSSSFASIFWLKKRGLMPGLDFSNHLINRDESSHVRFCTTLYKHYNKLPQSTVHEIFSSAVELECEFVGDALPIELIGMNSGLMRQYVKFVADRQLVDLGYSKIYNVDNPFSWMDLISLTNKTNFFEKRVGDYRKASVGVKQEDNKIKFDADF